MWAGFGHFSAKLNISLAWLGDRLNQLRPGNQCSSVVELKTGRLPSYFFMVFLQIPVSITTVHELITLRIHFVVSADSCISTLPLYWSTSFKRHLWNLASFKTLFRSLSWLGLRFEDCFVQFQVLQHWSLGWFKRGFFQQGRETYGFFYDEPPILLCFEPSNMLRANAKHVNKEKLHEAVLYEGK